MENVLSNSEIEILKSIVEGKSNKEISDLLFKPRFKGFVHQMPDAFYGEYILEGEVEVTDSETGDKIDFKTGDLVQFETGLKCIWNVKKPVRKHYSFDLGFGEID